jgi:hypothetical protein
MICRNFRSFMRSLRIIHSAQKPVKMSPFHHPLGGITMVPTLFFYQLGLVALMYVFLMLCWLWPNAAAAPRQPIAPSKPPRRQRCHAPKPFTGLT